MNNNCKNLKQKLDRTLFCKKKNKTIKLNECNCCRYKEYKNMTTCRTLKRARQKSKKLTKLEKNRFSILTVSNKCCKCPSKTDLTWHEVFRGRNRANSMKYGLCLRLCYNCHEKYQEDKEFNDYWHQQAQLKFNEVYPDLDFLEIFKRNYL